MASRPAAHKTPPAVGTTPPPLRVAREQPAHFATPDALGWPSFIHHAGTVPGPGAACD